MRRISRSQWQRQPWRNGGGVTWEIWRDGVEPAGFVVRLSCAEVSSDGPFSAFPGVDRVIALVQGGGMTLEGEVNHALSSPLAPLAFPGEARVHGRLTHGPVLDVNLMVAREAASARVRRVVVAPGDGLELVGTNVLVFAPFGGVRASAGERGFALAPMDTVVALDSLRLHGVASPEAVLVAEVTRQDRPTRIPPPPGLAALFEAAIVEVAGPPLNGPAWVVTACNPHGSLLDEGENARRMAALEAAIVSLGLAYQPAVGRDDTGSWAEASVAITSGDRETALSLARDFEQDAIYELDALGNRTVRWC